MIQESEIYQEIRWLVVRKKIFKIVLVRGVRMSKNNLEVKGADYGCF